MRKSRAYALILAITFAIVPPAVAQSIEPPLPLAEEAGAWVVELTTREGVGLVARTVAVSSTGDVRCDDGMAPGCEPPRSARLADILQPIVSRAGAHAPWADRRLLLCSDCPAITLTIYRRVESAKQLVTRYRWTPLSQEEIPELARQIHAALSGAAGR